MDATQTKLSYKHHALFWLGFLLIFSASIWLLHPVLLPFLLGATIAYLLNPIVEYLSRYKISRLWATSLILLLFISIIVGIFIVALPFLYREALQLANNMPDYIDALATKVEPYKNWIEANSDTIDIDSIQNSLKENIGKALSVSTNVLSGVISGGQAVLGFMSTLFITPIVAFFMMKEWECITSWIDKQIPRQHHETVTDLVHRIDRKIAGFVRGQLTLALFLGIIYAVALSVASLNYSVLIGMVAGLLSIIPLIGSIFGLLISVVVAWFQEGELSYVGTIAAIFLIGQVVEGNILAPKLLGENVGLHPLWILFALVAGGSLMGLAGMLLAVPMIAAIGVLVGYALKQYRKSQYYNDININVSNAESEQKARNVEIAKQPKIKKTKASTKKTDTKKTSAKKQTSKKPATKKTKTTKTTDKK